MNNEINFSLSYDCRNSETRSTIMNLNICFENPSKEEIKNNINTWLKAIGCDLQVVDQ